MHAVSQGGNGRQVATPVAQSTACFGVDFRHLAVSVGEISGHSGQTGPPERRLCTGSGVCKVVKLGFDTRADIWARHLARPRDGDQQMFFVTLCQPNPHSARAAHPSSPTRQPRGRSGEGPGTFGAIPARVLERPFRPDIDHPTDAHRISNLINSDDVHFNVRFGVSPVICPHPAKTILTFAPACPNHCRSERLRQTPVRRLEPPETPRGRTGFPCICSESTRSPKVRRTRRRWR